MKLSVVIPNFNGQILLERNLPKILPLLKNAQIIIVDDASTDESVALIKKKYPQITLIEKVSNNGFSTTVNLGVKAAIHELVLLLNSDAVPKRGFEKEVFSHFENDAVFAIGCLDESIEEGKVVKRGRGIGKFERGFLLHRRGEVNKQDTLWVSGGSSFFRKNVWMKLGGMDELYNPFYWEDIDLSYRALKSGYKIIFEPRCIVTHNHMEGSILKNYSEETIRTITYRNQIIFMWKNITDTNLLTAHLFWLPVYLIKTFLKGDLSFGKGLFKAIFKLSLILTHRKFQTQYYKRTDEDIVTSIRV